MRPGSWYVSLVVCISHLHENAPHTDLFCHSYRGSRPYFWVAGENYKLLEEIPQNYYMGMRGGPRPFFFPGEAPGRPFEPRPQTPLCGPDRQMGILAPAK